MSPNRRFFRAGALGAAILLLSLAVTQGLGLSPARAATALLCDQNTIYGIESGANAGVVDSIDVTTGATAALPSFGAATNALGITPNGLQAYALINSGTATTTGTIYEYDMTASTPQPTQITGVTIPANTYRGAINPLTKIYYYAQGNTTDAQIYGYNTVTGARLGLVGTISGLTASNGDMAFSTSGQLYIASGAELLRLDQTVPTVGGTAALSSTVIANLPAGTNTPGVAFSADGYLYVTASPSLYKINPSSGALVATTTMANGFTPVDLASCNYPNSLSGQSSVDTRWQAGDQFTTTVTGNGIALANTATSTGTATGLQTAKSGANLTVPGSTYTVTQTAAGTTSLANYTTTYVCTNTNTGTAIPGASGTGNVASVTLPTPTVDGIDINCVFTNKLIAVHATAVNDAYSTPKNTALTIAAPGILANDTGTGATFTSNTQPAHGTVVVNANGGFTYTPTTGFAGTDTYTYTITDSAGATSTATVSIVVGPIAATDTGTVVDGATLTTTPGNGNVLDNDQGVGLTASNASVPAHGTVTLSANGNYTYTPTTPYSGADSFTYRVTDSAGHTDTGTVNLTVLPKAVDDTLTSTTLGTTVTIPVAPSLTNDLGTGLSVTAVGTAAHGSVTLNAAKTSFVYVANGTYSGPDTFTYTVTDSSGKTSTATETIGVKPVAVDDTLVATPAATPDTISSATLLSNDKGTGLTVTGVSSASTGTVTLSGTTITFTPAAGFSGNATFVYTVTDSSGQPASATATVPVNPGAVNDTATATSGQALTVATPGVLANDNGTGLSATVVTGPTHGTLTLNTNGSYVYTPASTFSGTDTFTYKATDSAGRSTTATDTITVLPLAVSDALPNTSAGTARTLAGSTLLANDNGSTLTITSVGTPAHGTAVLNANGSVTYTPATNWSGPDSFSYTISDGTNSSTATDTITTTPVAVNDTLPSTPVNTAKTIPAAAFTGNDRATTPTIASVGTPSHGTATLAGDKSSVTYTPAANFSGTDSFTYTIADATGQTSTATATINVTPTAGTLTTTATAGIADPVPAAQGLLSQSTGSNLTVAVTTNPQHGSVTLGTAGAYTYTPAANFSGTDTFGYTVTDANGQTATGTVTVTVLPKANEDMLGAIAPGTSTIFPATAFTANDGGAGLRITAVTQPAIGTVVLNADGTVTFTAGPTASGDATFTYTITDAAGRTSAAPADVTISDVATPDSATTPAGSTLTVAAPGVLGNDTGTNLKATLGDAPLHGTVQLATDGSYVYKPTAGFSGIDRFTYTATDTNGDTATGLVTITITPTAVADALTAPAGTTTALAASGVLSNDLGTAVTVTKVGTAGNPGTAVATTAGGSVTISTNGAVSYTPPAGFSGTDTVTYTITDGNGIASATPGTLTITVTPTAVDDTLAPTPVNTTVTIPAATLTGNDQATTPTITAVGVPAHGTATLAANGSTVTYKPASNYSGADSFTYTITDASGQKSTATATIKVTPTAGNLTTTATSGAPDAVPAAQGLLSQATGSDLTVAIATNPQHGTVTLGTGGAYTYTPSSDFSGTDTFTFTVTDSTGQTSTGTVSATVLPKANDDALGTVAPGTTTTFPASSFLTNDAGAGLTITAITQPATGSAVLNADGTVTVTANATASGDASFTYTITDSAGRTSTAKASLTIGVAAKPDTGTTPAGTPLTVAAPGVLGNDTGTGLTATLTQAPAHGTVQLASNGSYVYTPTSGFSGTDTFTYAATDTNGSAAPGVVTITVTPVATPDSITALAGTTTTVAAPGVLANDLGGAPTVTRVGTAGAPGTAVATTAGGSVTISANGAVSYTPKAGFSGTDTVTYTITDASGVVSAAPGTITFTVKPVAVDDTLPSIVAGGTETVPASTFLGNDSGTELTVTAVGTPAHGTATLNANGTVTYKPTAAFSGTDSFTYTVTDASGQTATATASVSVTPTAAGLSTSTVAGVVDHVPAANGLLSASTGTGLVPAITTQPQHGTAALVGTAGAFDYTPATDFSGTDTFGYSVTDPSGGTANGTVTVTVLPKANADSISGPTGTPIVTPGSSLLANDHGTGIRVTSVTQPTHGTTVLNADGSVTYTPADGTSGPDSYTYTITDTAGGTSTATVTIGVGDVARPDSGTTTADRTLTTTAATGVLANDSGSALKASLVSGPTHGTLTLNADGSYTYTPNTGFSGNDSFVYTATDASGNTATATATLVVDPLVTPDTVSVLAGTPAHEDTRGVLANDDGSGLAVTAVGTGAPGATVTTTAGGTVVIKADGTLDYTPKAGFSGNDTVTYTVTDTSGNTGTATITFAVAPRAVDDSFTTPSATALAITSTQLTGNDLGSSLGVVSTTTPAHGTLVANGATYTYTPEAGFSGTDSFTYTVRDASGQTATATARILVGDLAADHAYTTPSSQKLTVTAPGLLAGATGTGLTAALDSAPTHGTVTVDPTGAFVYTPATGFSGTDSFTYRITDGSGQVSTGTATVTVTPVANDDTLTAPAGTPIDIPTPGVLGNDSGTGLHVTAVGTPQHGTATVSGDGAITFKPTSGYSGTDTFGYTVTDQDGRTGTGTITVHVTPVAVDDSATTPPGGAALTVPVATGLLSNDTGTGLTATLATGPSHGTVTIAPDGSYVYTPAAGFSGTDTFTYTATDSSGQATTATVTLTVPPLADAVNDTASGTPGQPVTIDPLSNDSPTSGATLDPASLTLIDPVTGAHVRTVTLAGKGTFAIVGGRVVFTPVAGFTGNATVQYQVTDSDGVTVTATIAVAYPTPAPTIPAGPAGTSGTPVAGVLAFTGSAPFGAAALLALLAIGLGVGLRLRSRRGRHS
ncbi:Ig-like domain-containing protein [Frondihabitans cladoniiphilus]|uniref:Ig-like domain-containing protein n=1 Tax=Frondihabitans cladoniiphilus TaxID=715785 RepID=UPI0031EAEFD5